MERLPLKKMDLFIGAVTAAAFIGLSLGAFEPLESLEKVIYGMEMRLVVPANGQR